MANTPLHAAGCKLLCSAGKWKGRYRESKAILCRDARVVCAIVHLHLERVACQGFGPCCRQRPCMEASHTCKNACPVSPRCRTSHAESQFLGGSLPKYRTPCGHVPSASDCNRDPANSFGGPEEESSYNHCLKR